MSVPKTFYANGKLLITGEYLVLEGARSLALPLKVGQRMKVTENAHNTLIWRAFEPKGLWFETVLDFPSLTIQSSTNRLLAEKLNKILKLAFQNVNLNDYAGLIVETHLDFSPDFGFGSSSTLISLLSQFTGADAYWLNKELFGGSGYDVACATAKGPVIYSLTEKGPTAESVGFFPAFHEQIYFVYLGQKQQSSLEIERFKKQKSPTSLAVQEISEITESLCRTTTLDDFERLLRQHEAIVANVLNRETVQNKLFSRYQGVVKSLGAWGGDFVLVTTQKEKSAFVSDMNALGYHTLFSFAEIVMPPPDYF